MPLPGGRFVTFKAPRPGAGAVAESKRRPGGTRTKGPDGIERLTPLNLALNALATFVAAPALFVLGGLFLAGQLGDEASRAQNQHLFLGSVLVLIGVFLVLLNGLKVWEHVKARRRFDALLGGEKKSAVLQNLDELTRLARALGPGHRKRLEARLDEWGVKR